MNYIYLYYNNLQYKDNGVWDNFALIDTAALARDCHKAAIVGDVLYMYVNGFMYKTLLNEASYTDFIIDLITPALCDIYT